MASLKTLFFVLAALVAVGFVVADEDKKDEKRAIPLGYGYSGLGYAGLGYSGLGYNARSAYGYSGYPAVAGYSGYAGAAYPYAGAYHGASAYPYAGYGYY